MKWLLFLLLPISLTGQQVNNFYLKNSEVIWRDSFTTTQSFQDFAKMVSQSGLFDKVDIIDSSISGRTINITPDHKGAGYTGMNTPNYLLGNYVKGYAVITFSNGNYIVELKRIVTIEGRDVNAGILSTRMGQEYPLEFWAANNKKTLFRNHFENTGSKILNHTFKAKFSFSP